MNITRHISSPSTHLGRDADEASALMVLLHGFGSHETDLVGVAEQLGILPWVSLRAPIALPHGGFAWFPITTPGNPDAESVTATTTMIWNWIDEQVPADTRIVPVGFSQGGLMATQLLRTRPEAVAATVVLGGFVQAAEQPADARLAAERPAVFWGRGQEDRVIAASAVERTREWLPKHSTLTSTTYPGLAHGINTAEIDDVRDFLRPLL